MAESNVGESANGFAIEMFRKLAKSPGNVFFSPFSIVSALAMTSLGAKENTLKEMLRTLKMEDYDKDVVHSWFKNVRRSLLSDQAQKDYTLSVANRLFGEKSFKFLEKFLQDTSEYYSAKLEPIDFKNNSESSRKHINDWVSNETNNKINDILVPDTLQSSTKLVLVNAIYFKGDWLSKFKDSKTKDCEYYVTETEVIKIPLMYKNFDVDHGYSMTLQSQLLELPYKGNDLSMIIILPNLKETTLEQVEIFLTPSDLSSFHLSREEIDVWLPKFKLESSFDLNAKLIEMGMVDLFKPVRADLSGMDGSKELCVTSVVHKAFIEVNEGGTEAAAATAIMMCLTSCAPPPIIHQFKADHPFLFFIRHNRTNSVLFFGRFIKP